MENKKSDYIKRWKRERPWYSSYKSAKERCLSKKHISYKDYGGRGILFLITPNEIKDIWFRDCAYEMKKPSIDRIDNNGNYEKSNCRFIEASENARRSHINRDWTGYPHKAVNQISKSGELIATFKSSVFASKITGITLSCIRKVLHKQKYRKTAGGYNWEYVI